MVEMLDQRRFGLFVSQEPVIPLQFIRKTNAPTALTRYVNLGARIAQAF